MEYSFRAEVSKWPGDGGWYLVRVPRQYFEEIKLITSERKRGFGAVKVSACIGDTNWQTSIFPDNEDGSYLLFLKKQVRAADNLEIGSSVNVSIELLDI